MSANYSLIEVDDEAAAFLGGEMELFTGDRDELVSVIAALVDDDDSHLIVTPNVDQVLRIQQDDLARVALSSASLRVVDGMPLVALLRAIGAPNAQRHTGADLLPLAAQLSATRGWRIALVGGKSGVADEAVLRLMAAYPGSDLVAVDLPMLDSHFDPASLGAVETLCDLEPHLVFLCMGFPRQESWYLHWKDQLPDSVYLGAGAAVDFAAGSVKRAPEILQSAGFEWLFRLGQEPRRLGRRYLITGPRFLVVIFSSLRAHRRNPSKRQPATAGHGRTATETSRAS